jgi:hypothetical protein
MSTVKVNAITNFFAGIHDDGLCCLTCTAEYQEFQDYLKNGGQLQDADCNVR